jgi:hypothetical protein
MTRATWFFDNGIPVFPIIRGTKEPACKWPDYVATREQAAGMNPYGVVLGLLAVVDADVPDAEAWASTCLPDTPLKVTTGPFHDGSPGRGRQHWFRLVGDAPHDIHRDGLTMEFRHRGQYCLGAGGRHPSGMIYTADPWSWDINDVPFFPVSTFTWDDRPLAERGSVGGQPLRLSSTVAASERHATLHRVMRSLAARGVPIDGAVDACLAENLAKCRPPLKDRDLDKFLRRAYRQPDRADFERTPQTGWDLCAGLIEIGLSPEASLVAVRSVTPDFDPNAPEPTLEPGTPTADWDLDTPGGVL